MAETSGIQVRFGADTTDLNRGLDSAMKSILAFGKAAAGAIGAGLTVKAFVDAGQAALDYADAIGKTAQKIGSTSEELSRLEYAARLSDVSLGQLQVGLGLLSKNMENGSAGLQALGISATDAMGNLRTTGEVMADVASKFAGMQDGAGKTAIAMDIFGRSGADLIPLLNSGRDGLAEMSAEADRLGVTISGETAQAAQDFNDNITRLHAVMQGFTNQIINPLLPTLLQLSQALLDLMTNSENVQIATGLFKDALMEVAKTAATTYQEIYALGQIWNVLAQNGSDPQGFTVAMQRWGVAFENIRAQAAQTDSVVAGLVGTLQTVNEGAKGDLGGPASNTKTTAPRLPDLTKSGKGAQEGVNPAQAEGSYWTDRLKLIQDSFKTEQELKAAQYQEDQQALDLALQNKLIKEQEYYDLSSKLAKQHETDVRNIQASAWATNLGYASDFFGSMAQIAQLGGKKTTKIAKVFAIAQALISTFQGAAKALTLPYPANLAAYAQVLATGLGAVASIKGVSDSGGGGGGGGSVGASRGGGKGGGSPAAASPTTTFAFTLTNDPMGFGEKFARQFIDQLNSTQRNGGQIRGVIA